MMMYTECGCVHQNCSVLAATCTKRWVSSALNASCSQTMLPTPEPHACIYLHIFTIICTRLYVRSLMATHWSLNRLPETGLNCMRMSTSFSSRALPHDRMKGTPDHLREEMRPLRACSSTAQTTNVCVCIHTCLHT